MYTQCPHCLTVFEINEDALQASLGIVHCGHCAQRFDALRTLSESVPVDPDALPARDPGVRVPTLTTTVAPGAREARTRHGEAVGDTLVPGPPFLDLGGLAPGEGMPADMASPAPDPITPDDSSDWFAELEPELNPAWSVEAARGPPYETRGHNAWQVSDLPAGPRFLDTDVAITFEDSWTPDPLALRNRDWRDAIDEAPIGAADDGIPDAAGEPAAVDPDPSASAHPTVPFEEIGPADLADFEPWRREGAGASSRPDSREAGASDRSDADRNEAADGPDVESPQPVTAEADPIGHPADEPAGSAIVSDPARPLPPVYVPPRRRHGAGILWALGCLALALALAAQLAWIQRADLVRNPATRGWATRVCARIDCRLPPIRDVAQLELLSRDVRPDPERPGALMITATVRNDASFRQPWPVVVVQLTDLDNHPVAMRRFLPVEYMPDPARRAAGIAPGATSAIAFEVADPGRQAVAFQFSFE